MAFTINNDPRVLTAYDANTGSIVTNRVLKLRDEYQYEVEYAPAPVTTEKDGKKYMSIPEDSGNPIKKKVDSDPVEEKPSEP